MTNNAASVTWQFLFWMQLHYTVSQKNSPFLFLWLLGQMLTDFNLYLVLMQLS